MMKETYLQTIINGCAWCKRFIGVSTHEVDQNKKDEHVLLSHGICEECSDDFEEKFDLREDPEGDSPDLPDLDMKFVLA
jgi:hypothetical protein